MGTPGGNHKEAKAGVQERQRPGERGPQRDTRTTQLGEWRAQQESQYPSTPYVWFLSLVSFTNFKLFLHNWKGATPTSRKRQRWQWDQLRREMQSYPKRGGTTTREDETNDDDKPPSVRRNHHQRGAQRRRRTTSGEGVPPPNDTGGHQPRRRATTGEEGLPAASEGPRNDREQPLARTSPQ